MTRRPAGAMIAIALAIGSMLSVHAHQVPQAPARDNRTEPTGTGSISGTVRTTEATPRTLRLATVTLSGDQLVGDRQCYSEADGHFEFANLPPGQYQLAAFKSGYMRESYGAKRPGGTGTPIDVAVGQHVTDASIALSRYGVITGTIYDQNGEPAQGASVEVMAYTMRTGRRILSSVYGRPQTTDDRGVYRAGGLLPGDYFIAAGISPDDPSREMQLLSTADVDRVLQTGSFAEAQQSPRDSMGPVSFAPVFFPGAADLSSATKITLGLAEERGNVDFALRVVPTARIDGVVTLPRGQSPSNVQLVATLVTDAYSLDLFRGTIGSARPDANGHFSYRGLSPGHYVITARTPAGPSSSPLWALADVTVNGTDQTIALEMQEGMSIGGKVVFDGTTLKHPESAAMTRITMPPSTSGVSIGVTAPAVAADGTFTITGVAPGSYKLAATAPPSAPGWMAKSAMVGNVDALDLPFEIKPNQSIDGAVITFTDHPSELSGVLQTSTGMPTSSYFIIVFSTDKAFWTPSSRRSEMARPSTSGAYTIRNLPVGEYFVAALTDVELNAWFDPAFLEQLVPSATKITIADGQKTPLDLRIGG